MTPKQFWKCTPAKLNALNNVHVRLNTPSTGPKVAKTVEEAGIDI